MSVTWTSNFLHTDTQEELRVMLTNTQHLSWSTRGVCATAVIPSPLERCNICFPCVLPVSRAVVPHTPMGGEHSWQDWPGVGPLLPARNGPSTCTGAHEAEEEGFLQFSTHLQRTSHFCPTLAEGLCLYLFYQHT